MLKVVKGLSCPMEAFDLFQKPCFRPASRGVMSSLKRIIRQGKGSLVQIVYLSGKRMQKIQEYLGKGKYSCKT